MSHVVDGGQQCCSSKQQTPFVYGQHPVSDLLKEKDLIRDESNNISFKKTTN